MGLGIAAPSPLIRLEGLAAFAAGVAVYGHHGDPLGLFVALFLVPDLSIAAFALGPRIGSVTYNLVHTYVWPALSIGVGIIDQHPLLTSIGLIWLAHIGIDRALGLGLKYPSGFRDTHLQRL